MTEKEVKILLGLNEKNISLNGVTDTEVRKELKDAMSNYPKYLKVLPNVLSFDEFKADTTEGTYSFPLNDPIKKKTLDILPTKTKFELEAYFTNVGNRNNVQYVISDMYEPYLIVTKIMFPKAKYVVDRFHYIRYIMDALDKIRIRSQKSYGEKSKQYKLLKNKKNVSLLRNYARKISWFVYTKRYKNGHQVDVLPMDILNNMLSINDDLKREYELKESFLDIINHSDYNHAKTDIICWIELCKQSEIEEYIEALSRRLM